MRVGAISICVQDLKKSRFSGCAEIFLASSDSGTATSGSICNFCGVDAFLALPESQGRVRGMVVSVDGVRRIAGEAEGPIDKLQ